MGWRRQTFLAIGSRLAGRLVRGQLMAAEAMEMGRWLRDSGYRCTLFAPNREELFEAVGRQIENKIVLYLEFGVFEGASMRSWSSLLKNPKSSLHGFDSFIGLPEDWLPGIEKGHFSTNGECPVIPDPRVKFFKGWFQETLPHYSLPPHDVMVVNVDSDLYLPARYVLDFLSPHFRPGDFVYFDNFHVPHDEVRAFREFMRNTGITFSLFGTTKGFARPVFKCDGIARPSINKSPAR